MHPEIRQEQAGRCPKCRMELVQKGKVSEHKDRGLGTITWRNYLPLMGIILFIFSATLISAYLGNDYSFPSIVSDFMAGFFIVFSVFKILDLKGFAEGYSTYDILALKFKPYAYVYPFIEMSFGLAMLYGVHNPALLWSEFGVMAFSGLGVAIKVSKGDKFQCVCLGTMLKVPLTYITLVEDFGMAVLALILIFN